MPDRQSPSAPEEPKKEISKTVKADPKSPYAGRPMEIEVNQLMAATKAGDRDAFDRLVDLVRPRAFHSAHSLVGSREDAFDMAQEAFLKTYRARETYRETEPFLPWFHRILRNTCFSFLRKTKRVKKVSLSGKADEDDGDWEMEGLEPSPESGVENEELHGVFWAALNKLGGNDREMLSLRHFQELSYKEIAELLEIPEGTVMSRLFHARRHLREHLNPHLDGALAGYGLENEPQNEDGKD
ncbi:MAG: RNA polymerase sigma-70 factor (ECF subfamily) [Planctomycetota bacterium]|jgi:RNA polymerase sigma-70 factor (ECF subfamily)